MIPSLVSTQQCHIFQLKRHLLNYIDAAACPPRTQNKNKNRIQFQTAKWQMGCGLLRIDELKTRKPIVHWVACMFFPLVWFGHDGGHVKCLAPRPLSPKPPTITSIIFQELGIEWIVPLPPVIKKWSRRLVNAAIQWKESQQWFFSLEHIWCFLFWSILLEAGVPVSADHRTVFRH